MVEAFHLGLPTMPTQRRTLLTTGLIAALLSACGGGDDESWDEFRPRATTVDDLEFAHFEFTDFSFGAVFDPSLGRTTTLLSFGEVESGAGSAGLLGFGLLAAGAAATGDASLDAGRLTLTVIEPSPQLPFVAGQVLRFAIDSDVDDGRIRLRNESSGVEQTSAPMR